MLQYLYPTVGNDMMTVTVGYFCAFPLLSLVWCTFVVRIDIIWNILTGDFGNTKSVLLKAV